MVIQFHAGQLLYSLGSYMSNLDGIFIEQTCRPEVACLQADKAVRFEVENRRIVRNRKYQQRGVTRVVGKGLI